MEIDTLKSNKYRRNCNNVGRVTGEDVRPLDSVNLRKLFHLYPQSRVVESFFRLV